MPPKIRHIVILSFLIMSFIPFMLITDLFPFMRFGMFCVTIKVSPQKELFVITIQKTTGEKESLSKRQIAMDDSHLNYLTRTYYYQNNINFLADELLKSGLVKKGEHLIITQNRLQNRHWISKVLIDKQ